MRMKIFLSVNSYVRDIFEISQNRGRILKILTHILPKESYQGCFQENVDSQLANFHEY